jgi:hypothetical protein
VLSRVSGLYKEALQTKVEKKVNDYELELRIDIDGDRAMNVISGDLYSNSGRKHNYISSFQFEKVKKVKNSADEIRIIGKNAKYYSDLANFTSIQIKITLESASLNAAIKLIDYTGLESEYLCRQTSKFFRKVQIEHDYEEDTVQFESYNTSQLFSPPQHHSQSIGISEAFAEAGIQISFLKKEKSFVPHPKKIPLSGSVWTQDELYNAMVKNSTSKKRESQWFVWLLSAKEYVISDVKGTMLSLDRGKGVGCAVFQNATGWQSSSEKRMMLFIYVHELGHCFNLHHPWSRKRTGSLEWINAHSTLSWMNYPWRYYLSEKIHGEEAFWERFPFQFSDSELIHLRHGFRNKLLCSAIRKSDFNTFTSTNS